MKIKTGSVPSSPTRTTLPRWGLALGLLLLLSFTATTAAASPDFPDVPAHHPYFTCRPHALGAEASSPATPTVPSGRVTSVAASSLPR